MRLLLRGCLLLLSAVSLTACRGGGDGASTLPDADADGFSDAIDCAPQDAARWRLLSYAARNSDGDSRAVLSAGTVCTGGALPSGYLSSAAGIPPEDCDDGDASRWQLLDYASIDRDNDGRGIASAGERCSGAALDAGYLASAENTSPADCDDADAQTWRRATTYADRDADGIGAGPGSVACIGSTAAPGSSLYGYDPLDDPSDPTAPTLSDLELLPAILITPR